MAWAGRDGAGYRAHLHVSACRAGGAAAPGLSDAPLLTSLAAAPLQAGPAGSTFNWSTCTPLRYC